MSLTINTNLSSLIVQSNLNKSTNALNLAMERMTTGYKINHASDNAAGYSIAKSWEAKLGSLDVAADNAATGADMLSTLEDHYALVSTHIQRIRDLTEQAANGTYGSQSKIAIEEEIKARLQEVNRIAANCEFSGQYLMNNSITEDTYLQVGLDSDYARSGIKMEANLFADGSIAALFNLKDATDITVPDKNKYKIEHLTIDQAKALAAKLEVSAPADDADQDAIDAFYEANKNDDITKAFMSDLYVDQVAHDCAGLSTGDDAKKAADMLEVIDCVINRISKRVTTLGAASNRIQSAIDSIGVQSENILSSLSTLRDADVAEESSNYLKAQILQQASATLLATANQQPAIALNLL